MRFPALAFFVGFAVLGGLGISERTALARHGGVYLDVLSAEAVGEFRSKTYDVYRRSGDNETFVGNQALSGTNFLGGGLGFRAIIGVAHGLRVSSEVSVAGGHIYGELPWAATSTALRGELLGGIGYHVALGPLVLHGAGIVGLEYMSFKATNPATGLGALSADSSRASALAIVSAAPSDGFDFRLESWGLRAGLQAGAHLHLAKAVSLYGDATFDYDGQWRARFGFAVGSIRK